MNRSMQLHCIPITAFSLTDLFLDRISLEWDSLGSAMTNHKKLIGVTGPELPFFHKRRVTLKLDQSVKMPWEWELHAPIDHFHKWRPLLHSFVLMLIRPTALILKQVFFWNLLVVARLVGFISIKTKEYFIWPPLWKRSIPLFVFHLPSAFNAGFVLYTPVRF